MVLCMTNQTISDESDFLSPGEAAKAAKVSTATLRRMARKGLLRSWTLPSGHRRYSMADVRALSSTADIDSLVSSTAAHDSDSAATGAA